MSVEAFVHGQMHAHCDYTICHPSFPFISSSSFSCPPWASRPQSSGFWFCLATIPRIFLPLSPVCRGGAFLSSFHLGDYDTISVTHSRNECHKTKILVTATIAFGA